MTTIRCDAERFDPYQRCRREIRHEGDHVFSMAAVDDSFTSISSVAPSSTDSRITLTTPDGKLVTSGSITTSVSGSAGLVRTSGVPASSVIPHKGSPHPDDEVNRVAGYAKAWADDPDNRPAHLRSFAAALVDLRQRFAVTNDEHVDPDWKGSTWEYRDSVTEAFHRSGISKSDQRNIQNSARYHVGNIIRRRASADELTRAGLKVTSPLERAGTRVSTADVRRALVGLLAAVDATFPATPPDPMIDAVTRAREVLE